MCKQFTCCCTGNEASLRFWCKDMISESTVFYCTAVLVGGKQIVKMLCNTDELLKIRQPKYFISNLLKQLKGLNNGLQQVDASWESLPEASGLQGPRHQISRVQKVHHPRHKAHGQTHNLLLAFGDTVPSTHLREQFTSVLAPKLFYFVVGFY